MQSWVECVAIQFGRTDMDTRTADLRLLVRAFQLSKMLAVTAELDLAGKIGTEPVGIDNLARACGAQPDALFRLLRALAAFGIFRVHADRTVSHSDNSLMLRREAQPTLHDAAMYRCMPSSWAVWGKLEHTVRTGQPAVEAVYGIPNFEYLAQHPDEAELFNNFMQHSPDDRQNAVAEAYDFGAIGTIVDIGGGNGGFVAVLLQKYRRLQAVLLDSATAVADSEKVLGPLKSRCVI